MCSRPASRHGSSLLRRVAALGLPTVCVCLLFAMHGVMWRRLVTVMVVSSLLQVTSKLKQLGFDDHPAKRARVVYLVCFVASLDPGHVFRMCEHPPLSANVPL